MLKKKSIIHITFLLFIAFTYGCRQNNIVNILIPKESSQAHVRAANQLSDYLKDIYPNYEFKITHKQNISKTIKLNINPDISNDDTFSNQLPLNYESFIIQKKGDNEVTILSRSEKGLFNAVYALLEKLGYRFYLSFDSPPEPKAHLSFDEWNLEDSPLQEKRVVFNWHNFLSGCTGWNYENWKSWIDQSAKMRYNTIMVHAYGNNPMFSFEYNGENKEIGYLNTSNSGRDWGAQHVNDVRRLPGGEIFEQAVFGSSAALVPDSERVNAASQLMKNVFQYAEDIKMNIIFAIDVDTWSANPQNIIETLPQNSRIKLNNKDIVNPDTPEGFKYYKAQVKGLLELYPQISTIAIWRRPGKTTWADIKPDQFPESWDKEWSSLVEQYPELAKDKYAPSNFALSKIVKAYIKSLEELNIPDIDIAYGSWHFDFMPSADIILPKNVEFIPLDWGIIFDTDNVRDVMAKVGMNRGLIPIVWAHHDDHRYIGKPYLPYKNFNTLLKDRNASGFGIIHWTTHPLDLYFKSLIDQTWENSENKPLDETISEFCLASFGSKQDAIVNYMNNWIHHAPMFGRETTDHFVDLGGAKLGAEHTASDIVIKNANERLQILNEVDQTKLSASGKKLFDYYNNIENFYISFFEDQEKYNRTYQLIKESKIEDGKTILKTVNPPETIRLYVKALSGIDATPGEKAIVISMGTRWMPDFINLKQITKLKSIQICFGETKHDPLAQGAGIYTYFMDEDRKLWKCLGEKELMPIGENNNKGISFGVDHDSKSWVGFVNQLSIPIQTFGNNDILPGDYNVTLNFDEDLESIRLPVSFKLVNEKEEISLVDNKETAFVEINFTIKNKGRHFLEISNNSTNPIKVHSLVINPL